MNISTQRFSVFVLLVLLGVVSRSQGIKSFGKTSVSPRILATRTSVSQLFHRLRRSEEKNLSKLESTSIAELLSLVRGGEISLPDDDDEEKDNRSIILTKLRNTIRNILQFGDQKLPSIFSLLIRSCFKTAESITGISLLPPKPTNKKTDGKKKRRKATNVSKSKKKKNDSGKKNIEGEEEMEKTKKKAIKKRSSNVEKKAPSAATKKHLDLSIKSTNPNYRIQKELKSFIKSPPPNLSVQVGSNIKVWVITMAGAKNTIYEGEVFKLRVSFPPQYPTVPPSVYFLKGHFPTHEHVYTNGDICLSLLGKDWRPTMSAQSIAVSILSILSSAQSKSLPMDNAHHATNKPGKYQKDWVYHDDNC